MEDKGCMPVKELSILCVCLRERDRKRLTEGDRRRQRNEEGQIRGNQNPQRELEGQSGEVKMYAINVFSKFRDSVTPPKGHSPCEGWTALSLDQESLSHRDVPTDKWLSPPLKDVLSLL